MQTVSAVGALEKAVTDLEMQKQDLGIQIAEWDRRIEDREQELSEGQREREVINGELRSKDEALSTLTGKMEDLTEENSELSLKCEENFREKEDIRRKNEGLLMQMQMHISAEELTQHGEVKFREMEKELELNKQDNAKLSNQLVAYEAEMSTLQSKLQKDTLIRAKESATLKEQLSLYETEITQLEARCKAAEQKQKETLADCERSRLCATSISPELQARASSDEELRRLETLTDTQTKAYAEKEVALAHAVDKSCSSNASKAAGHDTSVSSYYHILQKQYAANVMRLQELIASHVGTIEERDHRISQLQAALPTLYIQCIEYKNIHIIIYIYYCIIYCIIYVIIIYIIYIIHVGCCCCA